MRTTITLNEQLFSRIKRRAAREGLSVSALIARIVQEALTKDPESVDPPPFRLVTAGHGEPLVDRDLDRTSALLAAEDEARYGNPSGS